jgi:hypothetical protein
MIVVLAPDSASTNIIVGRVIVVIHTADDNKQPCRDGQDFVDPDSSGIMRVPLGERIDYSAKNKVSPVHM